MLGAAELEALAAHAPSASHAFSAARALGGKRTGLWGESRIGDYADAALAGLLLQRSGLFRRWQERFVVLRGTYLQVSKLDAAGEPLPAHKLVPLRGARVTWQAARIESDASMQSFSLAYQTDSGKEKRLDFAAADSRRWVDALVQASRIADGNAAASSLTLRNFEVLRVLGSGGYGTVFLARWLVHPQRLVIALKQVAKSALEEDVRDDSGRPLYGPAARTARLQLQRQHMNYTVEERVAMERLRGSPYISQLRVAFQTRDSWFLGMDFFAGGDLYSRLKEQPQRRFSEDVVRVWAAQLVSALEFMHARGVVHRDVKAENVLLDGEGRVHLIDFGFAKDLTRTRDGRTESFCGTKYYLSPEMLRGAHGTSVDWWALGVLLFELLTGSPPFNHRHRPTLYQMILRNAVEFPADAGVSAAAQSFVLELLVKDPAERLGSRPGSREQLRALPFFAGVDWAQIEAGNVRGLFVPPPAPVPTAEQQQEAAKAAQTALAELNRPAPQRLLAALDARAVNMDDPFRLSDYSFVDAANLAESCESAGVAERVLLAPVAMEEVKAASATVVSSALGSSASSASPASGPFSAVSSTDSAPSPAIDPSPRLAPSRTLLPPVAAAAVPAAQSKPTSCAAEKLLAEQPAAAAAAADRRSLSGVSVEGPVSRHVPSISLSLSATHAVF